MRSIICTMAKSISPVLVLTLLLTSICFSACNNEPGFGIYLAESGELVLSDEHIEAYYWDSHPIWGSHTIELNEKGIEKWNSYMTYKNIPRLDETLHQADFVLRIEGEEIYRGKFYSLFSSASYQGVVILDALITPAASGNTIIIQYGYPAFPPGAGEDPRNNQEIFDYLDSQGLLK